MNAVRLFPSWLRCTFAGLLVALTGTALAGTYKSIVIDGSFDDWIGVPLAYEDPADSTTSADYRKIWIANDEDYFYLRFTLEQADDPFTSNDNIFIDADSDSTTGYAVVVGSEMLVQGGAAYEERNRGFNEGPITGLDWQASPSGSGTQFEARISRKARFGTDQSEVFGSPSVTLLLEAENANFARQETAPDAEGLLYEFASPPPALNANTPLVPLTASWRYRTAADAPGADWIQPNFDDTQSGWASGNALLGYSPAPASFPVPITTALSAAPTTHYLRTRFNWSFNATGVVLVGTNYLSDGAALYLNGVEVKRTRLPEGPLTASTLATGSPDNPAEPQIFSLPTSLLVQGENVLAVEIHQSPRTPTDLVYGLSLLAANAYPVTFPDVSQPADRQIVAGQPTTFAAEVIGTGPLTYQWLKDGTPIPDATQPSLTLDPVLAGSAGAYAVRVSNPITAAGATSRAAVLTVLSQPVAITTPPAPVTVTEGESATFTVTATGSAPLSYQWFKGAVAITDATNATLTIPRVFPADAGTYAVEVSNPAPSSQRSAGVALNVVSDTAAPSLLAISASPNVVLLQFSEPINGELATDAANYTLGGGLTLLGAQVLDVDPARVLLRTSAQKLGTRYEVTVRKAGDLFGNVIASPITRAFISTIRVDGSFDDWAGVEPLIDDPADAEGATDYAKAWVANDADFIYLRVQLHTSSTLSIFYNNIFVDTDATLETGFSFRGLGSEMLIQGGGGYQQKNGAFNEGTINGLDWSIQPEGAATDFELRFSRHATYATDGLPVFTGNEIRFFLESENTSFATVDTAPDSEAAVYTLINPPATDLGSIAFSRANGKVRLSWSGAGRLEATPSLSNPAWTTVAGATSPFEITASATAQFYRLAQ